MTQKPPPLVEIEENLSTIRELRRSLAVLQRSLTEARQSIKICRKKISESLRVIRESVPSDDDRLEIAKYLYIDGPEIPELSLTRIAKEMMNFSPGQLRDRIFPVFPKLPKKPKPPRPGDKRSIFLRGLGYDIFSLWNHTYSKSRITCVRIPRHDKYPDATDFEYASKFAQWFSEQFKKDISHLDRLPELPQLLKEEKEKSYFKIGCKVLSFDVLKRIHNLPGIEVEVEIDSSISSPLRFVFNDGKGLLMPMVLSTGEGTVSGNFFALERGNWILERF